MFEPLKELLFPVRCFGCKELGIDICSKCRRIWNSHFYTQNLSGLTVYSSIKYSPIARAILLSAKESSIKRADELLISALLDLIRRLPNNLMREAYLMPIPSSKKAIRKRGRDFIKTITKEVSNRSGIPMISGMRINRRLLDQSRLSAQDRTRNIAEAFEFIGPDSIGRNSEGEKSKGVIFLVDDLVTTGATLLEAKRALNEQGIAVNQAITACMAQPLNIGG